MNRLPEVGSPEREYVVSRLLSDTGFFCRYVLGMDSDRDERGNYTSEPGSGGVRDHGPHQEVVSFLDDPDPAHTARLLMAPRYSYKSSIARGFIMRKICAHPNISILLYMHEMDMAKQRLIEIREELVQNPILQELFPHMRGHVWRSDKFVTGLRTDKASDTPTLYVGSPQKTVTGSRPNLVVFDDIVTEMDLSPGALEKGRRCIERTLLLGARGCLYVNIGTPYHYADAHHWCMAQRGWKKCIHLDVGYDIVKRDDQTLDLQGTGRWPNLSIEFLRDKLRSGLSFPVFMSQYKLQVVSGSHQAFARHQFQPCKWESGMAQHTGYLLTDIATGKVPGAEKTGNENSLNVLMYVLVDSRNNAYIMDVECGRWAMLEFCDRYMSMVDRWSGRVFHRAEIWEHVTANTAYAAFLTLKYRERQRRPTILWQTRNNSALNKVGRINASQVRFQANQVFVCETVPRTWADDGEVRSLWDPEGYPDPLSGARLPGGDLVEQFVRFPHHPLMDLPDCFALIDSIDKETGQRVCCYVKTNRQAESPENQRVKITPTQRVGSADRFYNRIRGR
jgi:hypothetical protein